MKPVRIFIADDHPLVIEGLRSLIHGIDGFVLCGDASSGEEILDRLSRISELPDICILDIEMPGIGGVEALKIIKQKYPSIRILILTMHEELFYVNRVIREGADGYLLKNLNRESFVQSLQKIMNAESFFVERSSRSEPPSADANTHTESLTAREKHILKLIAQGKTNKQIASELFISNRTVDTHRNNLMRKLNISSSVQLVHYAYANNLV